MKIANAQNTQPNSTSGRLETKIASANGIEKYESAMIASELTLSQISSGRHSRQMPWGDRVEDSHSD